MDTQRPTLVTGKQLAELLQVGEDTIRRLTSDGRIPFIEVGPKSRRYDVDRVLAALVEEGRAKSEREEPAAR